MGIIADGTALRGADVGSGRLAEQRRLGSRIVGCGVTDRRGRLGQRSRQRLSERVPRSVLGQGHGNHSRGHPAEELDDAGS